MSTNYTSFMLVSTYIDDLNKILDLYSFDDVSLNGVQIEAPDREIRKVSFAVDACLDTIKKAVENKSDVLVVHHGLFWGHPIAITGIHYKRIKTALDGNLTLYAAHLPLDAHMAFGNNAQIALRLGMKSYDPFSPHRGKFIGVKGELPFEMSVEEISALLNFDPVEAHFLLNRGGKKVKSVAIVSGSASDDVKLAVKEGADLFITGEIKHEVFHTARESGIDVLAGGHYRSEVFGVQALKRLTEKKYNLETEFISSETGL